MAGGAGGVHVQHDALATQAQRLGQAKNELEAKLNEIKGQIQELISGPFKTETASASFGEAHEKWNTAARQCIEELTVMGQYLGKASAAFREVDQEFTVKL
jgi:WXG100 family type VII secretion target